MAILLKTLPLLALLGLSLFLQAALGQPITCETLGEQHCAYSVSKNGRRCVLEKTVKRSGKEAYTCRESSIEASCNLKNYVESDQCIGSCGLDRKSLGISSDTLLDARFVKKLCSENCLDVCSNILDLYFNLAAGEGVFLPKLCLARRVGIHRALRERHGADDFWAEPPEGDDVSGKRKLRGLDSENAESPEEEPIAKKRMMESDETVVTTPAPAPATPADAPESGDDDVLGNRKLRDLDSENAEAPEEEPTAKKRMLESDETVVTTPAPAPATPADAPESGDDDVLGNRKLRDLDSENAEAPEEEPIAKKRMLESDETVVTTPAPAPATPEAMPPITLIG